MANPSPPALPRTIPGQAVDASMNPTPQREELAITGAFGIIFQVSSDRVHKMPKIRPESTAEAKESNRINRRAFQNEKAIYERLGSHDNIIQCFQLLDLSIELALANQGNLEEYIRDNPPPRRTLRSKWIRLLADVFDYVHYRRVVLRNIALRNILVHNDSLKLCDFGESFLLPLGTDMEHFCVGGVTPQIEIRKVGCVFYSIAMWQVFEYDYEEDKGFLKAGELANDCLFAGVIRKCWNGQYTSMGALRRDVHEFAER